ncbi:MAG: hypothetical protein ACOC2Y_02350 [Spirochaetota bacterium]
MIRRFPTGIALVLVIFAAAGGVGAEELPDTRPLSSWQAFDPEAYQDGWLTLDRNDDGTVDYAVMVNDAGNKVREAADFNRDGYMDDFYFYENGVLQREEIDSNYDQRIDIWIYLRRGVYIEMWERDTDYDGVIDVREQYGSEAE